MQEPKKLQAATVLPPETISENFVSKNNFDLSQNLTMAFTLESNNTPDKELNFNIFLGDSINTAKYNATTVRGGFYDYASKGEIFEAIDNNNEKATFNINNVLTELYLDHSFYDDDNLSKNQVLTSNYVGICFDSTKSIFKEYKDAYNNVYFDSLVVKDLDTNLIVDPLTYTNPILIQIGSEFFIKEFIIETENFDILNLNNLTLRLSIENYGKIVRLDFLKPYTSNYVNFFIKNTSLNLSKNKNIKIGYGMASPIITYDIDKIANLVVKNFHIQGKLL